MNWDPYNHQILQTLIDNHGKESPQYNPQKRTYAVFDWDNTCIFNDCGEAFLGYQLEHLKLRLTLEQLRAVLLDEINGVNEVEDNGKKYRIADLNNDILKAYSYLRQEYEGFEGKKSFLEIQKTPQYLDFVTKVLFFERMYGKTKGIDPFYNYT